MGEAEPGENNETTADRHFFSRRNLVMGAVGLLAAAGIGGCYINEVEKTSQRFGTFMEDFDPSDITIPPTTEP